MTVFGLSPGRTARECASIAAPAMTLPAPSRMLFETLARLRSRSFIIDGEAVACDDNGVSSCLIELNGDDLRRDRLEVRKATLASMLAKAGPGLKFNEHIEGDGPTVLAHGCKRGLEGSVWKRQASAYRSAAALTGS